MWSEIAGNNSENENKNNEVEEDINIVEIPKGYVLKFRREINKFIQYNHELLEEVYNKCFKEYKHISKEDFYIFSYIQSNERL
jgi:hypothetical protein